MGGYTILDDDGKEEIKAGKYYRLGLEIAPIYSL